MTVERRAFPRVPIDIPCFVEMRLASGPILSVLVIDVSQGGLQVGIPPQEDLPADLLGAAVTMYNLPPLLSPDCAPCSGRITWVSSQRCGVQFIIALDISDDTLALFAETL